MKNSLTELSNTIVEFYEKLGAWENSTVAGGELSVAHIHLIEILQIYGSMKMKELAGKLGVTTGTLTVTVDKLESRKILKRVSNPDDRRSFLIALTEEGNAIQKEHSAMHLALVKNCTAGFTEPEIQSMNRLLHSFMEKI